MGLFRKTNDDEQDMYTAFIKTYSHGAGYENPVSNVDVFACVRIISHSMRQYELTNPNAEQALANLLLNGNAYYYDGVLLDPSQMTVDKIDMGIRGFKIKYTYQKRTLNNNKMLHLKYLSVDRVYGISPLFSLSTEITSAKRGLSAIKDFFMRSSFANGVLRIKDGRLNANAKREMKQRLASELTDTSGSGILVLDETIDFEQFKLDTSVFKLLEYHEFTSKQVAKAFGIPPHKFGAELVNSNDEIVEQTFQRDVISPLLAELRKMEGI